MTLNMPLADKISSVIFGLLGTSMFVGGLQMDRLEIRQIHPASIPGLVPMILGIALIICAALLYYEAQQAHDTSEAGADTSSNSWNDLIVCAVLSCIYALILVGWLPFYLATAIYITTFILYFGREKVRSPNTRTRTVITAFIIGTVTAIAVSALFRYGFLVRLP